VWFKVTVQHQSGFTTYRNKKKVAALQSVCANLDQQAKQALTSLRSRQPKPQET
jgi:bacterioferritin-associated ferredoxin